MKQHFFEIDKKFKAKWRNYVIQSAAATLFVMALLFLLEMQNAVVLASIGATVFIVFATPKTHTAIPKKIVGGHLAGLAIGALSHSIPFPAFIPSFVIYAAAVGITMFIMVVMNFEHPPACGTALGVAMEGAANNVTAALITSILLLSLIHILFRNYLVDLD